MPLTAGIRLGPYTIQALIGAGGMGEVYHARDQRLQRDVAIKVLPPGTVSDPTTHARFEREARAIAAVNHPHICAIHDVGIANVGGTDAPYIVMELLEGELVRRTALDVAVSPEGRRLLFATEKLGLAGLCDLPGCGNVKELALPSIVWAPDGKGVAYVDQKDGANIWEQPLDGGAPRQLTHFGTDQRILDFGWSPDGTRLAVSRGATVTDVVLIKGLR